MNSIFDGYNHTVTLQRGELLITSLTKLIKDKNIQSAWINGLGGVQWAELGFYNLETQQYTWRRFDQLLEITSIQGNIAWQDDEPVIHTHGTFSDSAYNAIGGHIKELEVSGTCELHLHTIFGDHLSRVHDNQTGLNLLHLH
jgi:predicted DNA-binding protein with PD1-like motif